jgi:hypothetical protein
MRHRLALLCAALLGAATLLRAQAPVENVVLVTIDGFRWQEVFTGMDSAIARNPRFNQGDSAGIFARYWSADPAERRAKLFPFLWSVVAREGQIYGNRLLGSTVDNANPYWFSYPGYSEILCGFVDTAINRNDYPDNPNVTLLEFLNHQPGFDGKVAAFGAWDAFDRIINERRSGVPVMSAFQPAGGAAPTPREQLLNAMLKDSPTPWGEEECLDLFTHYAAMEEFDARRPKILYLAYGETDEWAHSGQYASYLNAAHQDDAWLAAIWNRIGGDPSYAGKTALVVAVDHGRGEGDRWTSHGAKVPGAHEIWFAVLAPGLPAKGEITGGAALYQKQLAQTIASLLGLVFTADHPVAGKIDLFGR